MSLRERAEIVMPTIIKTVLFGLAIIALTAALFACDAVTLEQEVTYRADAPGMPLDAIQFRSPTFADGSYSWRVTDRQSGSQWWLVWMSTGRNAGQWLVLPIATTTGGAA